MHHKVASLADQVFEHLENDILSGKYKRGEILTETRLSEELGVSRTPIREALRRLDQEHLIEETAKGSIVVGMTASDIADICVVREHLEGECAARTAQNISTAQLEQLREVLELQEFYLNKKDSDHIRSMDNSFHQMIYKFSSSSVFHDTLLPLHKKLQKYRSVSVQNKARAHESVKEHRDIFEAIAAHDADAAREAAARHVEKAMRVMMDREEE